MRVLLQRSKNSSVSVDGKKIGFIENGVVLLVAFTDGDTEKNIDYMINKIIKLRIFDDENNIMNKSIMDVKGEVLSVSQFTLYATVKKGTRPSYSKALSAEKAEKLYDLFNEKLKKYVPVKTGKFGADMLVDIKNDGPVTLLLEG